MGNGMLLGWFDDALDGICSTIYAMLSIILRIMDWIQGIFRSLAGLEAINIDGQLINDGDEKIDIVFYLIQTDLVQDIFWSMITFSLILMFLMTGLAIIRNAYQEKPKPIGNIVGNVFKGLIGMILIPIVCLTGLMFGNIILQAVDAGTSYGNSPAMSTHLFICSAYSANIAREKDSDGGDWFNGLDDREENFIELIQTTNFGDYLNDNGASNYNTTSSSTVSSWEESDWEEIADHIDNAFTGGFIKQGKDTIDIYDPYDLNVAYSMRKVNFLILIVGGCIIIGFLFKMCFGLILRMFKLIFDFVLIPVVMAMMPFDDGSASKSWKSDFVKNTTMAYGTVGALNLYFSILPIVNYIKLENGGLFSSVLKLVMVIVGLFSAEKIISTVNGWFGGGDLLAEGKSAYETFKGGMNKVTSPAKKALGVTGKFVGAGAQGWKAAKADGKSKFGAFMKGGLSATAGDWAGKKVGESSFFKGKSEGEKTYKDQQAKGGWTTAFLSDDKQKEIADKHQMLEEVKKLKKQLEEIDKAKDNGLYQDDAAYNQARQDAIMSSLPASNYLAENGELEINGKKYTKSTIDSKKSSIEKEITTVQDVLSTARSIDNTKELDAIAGRLKALGVNVEGKEINFEDVKLKEPEITAKDTLLLTNEEIALKQKSLEEEKRKVEKKNEKIEDLVDRYNTSLRASDYLSDKDKASFAKGIAKSKLDIDITVEIDGKQKKLSELDASEISNKANEEKFVKAFDQLTPKIREIISKGDNKLEKSQEELKNITKEVANAVKKKIDEVEDAVKGTGILTQGIKDDIKKMTKKSDK